MRAVLAWVDDFDLDLGRVCGATTDGSPAMTGRNNGFVALLMEHCRQLGFTQKITTLHCIIHQELLCARTATLSDVMSVVMEAVKLVLSCTLNHRMFRGLLEEGEVE